jgi:hypothetical protein
MTLYEQQKQIVESEFAIVLLHISDMGCWDSEMIRELAKKIDKFANDKMIWDEDDDWMTWAEDDDWSFV